jgi:hypothetical protein
MRVSLNPMPEAQQFALTTPDLALIIAAIEGALPHPAIAVRLHLSGIA